MKRILLTAALLCLLAAPASAARNVYLKDGGVIQAQSVWRSGGKVHVLVNRDTLTEFNPREINLKRTFPKHKKPAVRRAAASLPGVAAAVPAAAAPQPAEAGKKLSVSLPALPSLPQKTPPSLGGNDDGTIRKHNKEMAERVGE